MRHVVFCVTVQGIEMETRKKSTLTQMRLQRAMSATELAARAQGRDQHDYGH